MKKFRRRGGAVLTRLSVDEIELLSMLVGQLVDLVSQGEPDSFQRPADADPFELWAQELSAGPPAAVQPPEDPVLRRMFPDAYRDDTQAAADFRRFTERDLRAKKIADAQLVLDRLASTQAADDDLRVPLSEVEAWLRTLTAVRLAVATRLEITDESVAEQIANLPAGDPRTYLVSVYDWLGFAQETMISAS